MKALRSARGSLLWTTWTSPRVGALRQQGVQFFVSQGVQFRMSLDKRRAERALHSAVAQPAVIHGLVALTVEPTIAGLRQAGHFMARPSACAGSLRRGR